MESLRAIQLIALKDVMCEPDVDAQWYRLARWYSKTFATPLHEVDSLPRIDLLKAWFSERYESLDEAELHLELQKLLNQEDPFQKHLNETKDEAAVDRLVDKAKAQNAANPIAKKEVASNKITKATFTKEMLESIEGLGEAIESLKELGVKPPKEEGFDLDFSSLGES